MTEAKTKISTLTEAGASRYSHMRLWAARGTSSISDQKASEARTTRSSTPRPTTKYLPAYRFKSYERDEGWGGQWRKTPVLEFDPLVNVGDEAPGRYAAPHNMIYHGVNYVRRVQQFEGRGICAMVEPIPGNAGGVYAVQDSNNGRSLNYMDIPTVICGDEEERRKRARKHHQQQPKSDDEKNLGRPAKKDALPVRRWSSVARHQKGFPELGAEGLGSYIAPDGKIYIGHTIVAESGTGTGSLHICRRRLQFLPRPLPRPPLEPEMQCQP